MRKINGLAKTLMALRIEDYALIGDMSTAALVGRNGSIDWLCLPRFDSGACFAALLGNEENGSWSLAPNGEVDQSRRRYRDRTMVLETEFETAEGVVSVIDFMPLTDDENRIDLVRIVCGRRGAVPMKTVLRFRFDYGRLIPWVRREGPELRAIAGPDGLILCTPVETQGRDFRTEAEFTVSEGERVPFTLTWFPSYRLPPPPIDPEDALQQTERWWRGWADHCTHDGFWREPVLRSLLTLKALTHAQTGGIVAAPTTSLPEAIGGVRNWDYRYCWIRDATFTLYALVSSGFRGEAAAWRDWLLRAVAGEPSRLQILYGIAGERRIDEYEVDWLSGYENSRCASATLPIHNCSSTSTARSWTFCLRHAGNSSRRVPKAGACSEPCSASSKQPGHNRTRVSGRCAPRAATLPIPSSWPGWRSTAQSRQSSSLGSMGLSITGGRSATPSMPMSARTATTVIGARSRNTTAAHRSTRHC